LNEQQMNASLDEEDSKKGAVCKSLGVILVILGALDCALAWRGGFEVSNFYAALLASGIFLYCIGAVRAANDPDLPS